MKYKVGEKVKVKNLDCGMPQVVSSMLEYSDTVVTITKADGDDYRIKEDNGEWNWTKDMFSGKAKFTQAEIMQNGLDRICEKLEEITKVKNEVIENSIAKGIEKISKSVNQRTIYDEIVQDEVLKKAKELSLKDIEMELHKDMEKYIKTNFGLVPKKIEIKKGRNTKKMEGIFHEKFEKILQIVDKGVPLMLTGPAGAGKNYTLEQVAKALDLDFYFTNAITQEYKLTGFIDANGKYQATQFYKAFKNGGLFFLDEVDASIPEALIILNGAIANGYFDFPTGRETAHKDFRVVCAGHTYGTGADMVYVGRNALDGATLDRFVVIDFDYDETVEKKLAYDDDLYNFIKNLRDTIKECSLRYIVSMRATINATKLLEVGISKESIIESVIIKNMQIDDLNTIINKISKDNKWSEVLEKIVKRMEKSYARN